MRFKLDAAPKFETPEFNFAEITGHPVDVAAAEKTRSRVFSDLIKIKRRTQRQIAAMNAMAAVTDALKWCRQRNRNSECDILPDMCRKLSEEK